MNIHASFSKLSLIGALLVLRAAALDSIDTTKYIKRDTEGNYQGLTDHSKKILQESQAIARRRKALFQKEFKQFDSVYHAFHITRLMEGNMFLHGPPGGAKSKFIKWLYDQDNEIAFELQMHQMMNEQVFVGGQNFTAAKEGRFEVNTKGSLADFRVALIDEIDKGNPATLAALLSLLIERKILAGNKVIISELETILSTSNSNIYEIYQQFTENGQRSTAAALLNRFTTIAFIPNWLAPEDQAELDYNYLAELDAAFNAQKKENTTANPLDWQELRTLAYLIVRPNEEFLSLLREFSNLLRKETILAIETQEERDSSKDTQDPYYPTAEYTERLREKMRDVILMSVFFDLLTSSLLSDIDALENTLKSLPHNRYPVGPFSLWRAYLVLTTVSFGVTKLVFPINNNQTQIDIDFGAFFTSNHYYPKDKREKTTVEYLLEEQERFKQLFVKSIEKHQNILKDSAEYYALLECMTNQNELEEVYDIERQIALSHENEDE